MPAADEKPKDTAPAAKDEKPKDTAPAAKDEKPKDAAPAKDEKPKDVNPKPATPPQEKKIEQKPTGLPIRRRSLHTRQTRKTSRRQIIVSGTAKDVP